MSAKPRPAGTVVLIRDGRRSLELLLLQRAARRDGSPGAWVFPGGKVEAGDRAKGHAAGEPLARAAAVRETREEAGLELAPESLEWISRWITPEISPKRFDTWFFVGAVGAEASVEVDGGEIATHRWLEPGEALAAHHARELRLAPPTFVTVTWLAEFQASAEALRTFCETAPLTFRPRICRLPQGACMLYPGDAGYELGDAEREGARHRLWALPEGYRYERSG